MNSFCSAQPTVDVGVIVAQLPFTSVQPRNPMSESTALAPVVDNAVTCAAVLGSSTSGSPGFRCSVLLGVMLEVMTGAA